VYNIYIDDVTKRGMDALATSSFCALVNGIYTKGESE